jgi:hypothetical protein
LENFGYSEYKKKIVELVHFRGNYNQLKIDYNPYKN